MCFLLAFSTLVLLMIDIYQVSNRCHDKEMTCYSLVMLCLCMLVEGSALSSVYLASSLGEDVI